MQVAQLLVGEGTLDLHTNRFTTCETEWLCSRKGSHGDVPGEERVGIRNLTPVGKNGLPMGNFKI
jgi:hypothetical protein